MQAGIQLGKAFKEGQERRRLEGIQNAKATEIEQGYTPQMGEQLQGIAAAKDAEGREFYKLTPQTGGGYGLSTLNAEGGYTPVEGPGIQPQRVTEFLGQRYEGGLTPDRVEALRTRAMAEGVSDPRMRQQMLMEATRAEREAEESPLRRQQLEQQVGLGKVQLGEAERKAEAAGRMDAFNTEFNTLQNPTPEQLKTLASKYNLDRGQQLEVTSQVTGIAKNELDAFDMDIKKAVKGKDLAGLIDLHKNDSRFGDGTHFVMAKGAGGQVVLNLVSDADPTKVLRTESFKDSGMATAYLRKAAEDPANLAEWMVGMRGKETAIRASEADIEYKRAQTGALGRKGLEQKFTDMEAILGRKLTEPEKLTLFGAAPKPREVTSEAVANLAKEMVGKPSGRMVDGKPERYTMQTATADARRYLSAGDTAAPQPVNNLILTMKQNAPAAKPQATAAGQGLLNLANEYMPAQVPPTPAPTSSQERMRGLYFGNR
jgi:hypothetical protein